MKFTKIASFAAILVATVQAADLTTMNSSIPMCIRPVNNESDPTAASINTASTNVVESIAPVNQVPSNAVSSSVVTPDSTIDEKAQKIMGFGLSKFGDLNQKIVQSFLKPEEWGRIDYHSNDDLLNMDILKKVMSTPSNSLTVDEKANRIMTLKPTPQKMGDLKSEMISDILTPEEWGKVDFYDNNAAISEGLLREILSKK